jgi:hypothetical protein
MLALAAAPALAAHHKKPPPAVQQLFYYCAHHNSLKGQHYPPAVLEQALADLPTDLTEYSICANEIKKAELQEVGGSHPLPAVSSAKRRKIAATAPTTLQQAKQQGSAPVDLAGQKIAAGAVTVGGNSLLSNLPTPILIVLVLLLALGSVPVAVRVQAFVRARRSR